MACGWKRIRLSRHSLNVSCSTYAPFSQTWATEPSWELKPYSDILDKMFTGLSDRLSNGERADTGWVPPSSTAVMDDGLRERMRRAIGARTWQEFLDAVYKLGLFRED